MPQSSTLTVPLGMKKAPPIGRAPELTMKSVHSSRYYLRTKPRSVLPLLKYLAKFANVRSKSRILRHGEA